MKLFTLFIYLIFINMSLSSYSLFDARCVKSFYIQNYKIYIKYANITNIYEIPYSSDKINFLVSNLDKFVLKNDVCTLNTLDKNSAFFSSLIGILVGFCILFFSLMITVFVGKK